MGVRDIRLLGVAILVVVLVGCKSSDTDSSTQTYGSSNDGFAGGTEYQQLEDISDQELSDNNEMNAEEELNNIVTTDENIIVDSLSDVDGTDSSAPEENDVDLNVVVNNVPNVIGENIVILEDQEIILSDLLANDSDQDADDINILDFSQRSMQGGSIVLISANVLKYTPAKNFNGSDSFSYVVSDGRGGSATATVNVVVDAINDMPQVTGEDIILPEDESVLLMGLIANDYDEDGDRLAIQGFSQGIQGGVVELLNENTLKYTPVSNYHGADSFTYKVTDGKGGLISATVNLQVQEVNDDPQVLSEVVTVLEDEYILLNNLLENDADIDADNLQIESFEQSENGLVELVSENVLRYVPTADFSGTDSFRYLVSDGRGGEAFGTVTIVVTEVNDVPVAKVDTFLVNQGQAKEINVLANDRGVSEDVKISIVALPKNGDVEVTADGKVIYTPEVDYFGTDSFVYQVTDKDDEQSVATAVLDVNCVANCNRVFALSWEPSTSVNITAYKVYYGVEVDNLDQVVELANVTNYDHFVDAKGEYFFAVSAVNDQNIESDLTGVVSGVF